MKKPETPTLDNPFAAPRVARDKIVSLRLSADEYLALTSLVKALGMRTIRDALRMGVANLIEQHNTRTRK